MNSYYEKLREREKKRWALLIDPDSYDDEQLDDLIKVINEHPPDLLLVGGSLLYNPIDLCITSLKLGTNIPVFLFPGNVMQLSDRVDGILFLSLLSGRNPEYLIGNHVLAAPQLNRAGIEVIPTGYLLVEGNKATSVSYMSNTRPIPRDKPSIAVATAMAGEMLGMKSIYLEAGSGAEHPVSTEMISEVRRNISIPLMVGGGISTVEMGEAAFRAGADMIVVGNAIERNSNLLKDFSELRDQMNQTESQSRNNPR